MSRARSRHRIVEKREIAMHADQFRHPADVGRDGARDGARGGRRALLRGEDGWRTSDEDEDEDDDDETRERARAWARLSMKTKILGPALLALGCAMLAAYALFALGAIELEANAERGTSTALVVVGGMCALAGGYSTLVMCMTRRGERGWSYDMIPGE